MIPTVYPLKTVFSSEYSAERSLCYYVNKTRLIQVITLAKSRDINWERVVFPGQRLLFEAEAEAILKIQTGLSGSSATKDEISCKSLCVNQEETKDSAFA